MKFKRMVLGLMLVFFLMVFSPVVSQGAVTNAKVTPVIDTNKNAYTVGEKITLSTQTTKAGYTYKFVWSKDNWKEWGVISKSGNNSTTYTPTKAGTYDFYLDIIDEYNNVYSTNKKVTVSPLKPVINTDKGSYTVGEKTTLSTPTTKAGYTYKFVWSRDNWKEWGVISNAGNNSTVTYTPTKAGEYEFYVDVKDEYENVYSTNKKVTVSPIKPVINTDKDSYTVGEKTTLSTPTTKAGYTYKFVWSRDNWKEWGVISNAGNNSAVNYTPTKAGEYEFYVDVKDEYENVYSTNKKVTVSPIKPVINTDKDSYTVGDKVNILTPTTGEGYKYKFVWSRDNWKGWGVISNPNNNSAVTYTPTRSGTYEFYLDITDEYGNVSSESTKVTADYTTTETKVCGYVNEYRQDNGRAPLTLDPELNKLAQIRAKELATMPKLEHKRPDGRDWKTVFAEYNVSRIWKGENIAWGSQYSSYATARGVTDGWIKSPGHRENILRPEFGRIGIGYAYVNGGHYWAQIFSD